MVCKKGRTLEGGGGGAAPEALAAAGDGREPRRRGAGRRRGGSPVRVRKGLAAAAAGPAAQGRRVGGVERACIAEEGGCEECG